MYLLLDANIAAAYYLPRSIDSKKARSRIENLLNSIRSGGTKHFLYIPNFCVAEVFSVFAKHAFGRLNPHVKNKGTIDKRVYASLCKQFARDIHNGRFFYHYELSRYHILGIDLVAPIDHYYKISKGFEKRHIPAGTFDHLIISMGIHLAHIHGSNEVCIVSTDDRLIKILEKCRSSIPSKTIKKLKLDIAEEFTGKPFSPSTFPKGINLKTARKEDLKNLFGTWPPFIQQRPNVYRWMRVDN